MSKGYMKHMLDCDANYQKAFRLAVLLPVAAALTALLVGLSWSTVSRFVPPCMFETLTGFNCLACGATRATFALAHGDWLTAVYYNPLYLVFLGWVLYLYLRLVMSLMIRPYRHYSFHLTLPQGIVVAAVCVAFTIIRNMPFYRAIFF